MDTDRGRRACVAILLGWFGVRLYAAEPSLGTWLPGPLVLVGALLLYFVAPVAAGYASAIPRRPVVRAAIVVGGWAGCMLALARSAGWNLEDPHVREVASFCAWELVAVVVLIQPWAPRSLAALAVGILAVQVFAATSLWTLFAIAVLAGHLARWPADIATLPRAVVARRSPIALHGAVAIAALGWIAAGAGGAPAWARFVGAVGVGVVAAAALVSEHTPAWVRRSVLLLGFAAFAIWIAGGASARAPIHTIVEAAIVFAVIERRSVLRCFVVGVLLAFALLAEGGRLHDPATPLRVLWLIQLELLVIAALVRSSRR